jgi:hypothetical protein
MGSEKKDEFSLDKKTFSTIMDKGQASIFFKPYPGSRKPLPVKPGEHECANFWPGCRPTRA